MKKDRVWKLDPFLRLSSFKKEDMLQLLTGIIVSQQVTRIARKKREFVFKMVELDDEVFYNLDEEVVFVYDFDQEREVFHFRLDCYRIRTPRRDVQKDPDGKNHTFAELQGYRLQRGRLFVPNFSGTNLRPNDTMNFFYSQRKKIRNRNATIRTQRSIRNNILI